MPRKIEISYKTIVFTVAFLVFLWFLYFIRDVILLFFVSLVLMAVFNPVVSKLSGFRIPRALAVVFVYLVILGLLGGTLAWIVPPLVDQTASFAVGLPKYLANLGLSSYLTNQLTSQLILLVGSLPGQLLKIGVGLVSNVIALVSVLILTFYLLLARNKLDEQLSVLFGSEKKDKVTRVINNLEQKLGGWARGEFFLMLTIGVFSFIGLFILGIPYALPLAILAGIFELVPNIGPIISSFPAVIIGFGISPLTGLAVVALAFLVHQLENYLFVPKIMEKSVGVSPIVTLLALAVGFKLAGITGVLISVPVFLTIRVLAIEYFGR